MNNRLLTYPDPAFRRAHDFKVVLDHLRTISRQLDSSHRIIQSATKLSATQDRALEKFESIARGSVFQEHSTSRSDSDPKREVGDICELLQCWATDINGFIQSIMRLSGHSARDLATQMSSHETDMKVSSLSFRTLVEDMVMG